MLSEGRNVTLTLAGFKPGIEMDPAAERMRPQLVTINCVL